MTRKRSQPSRDRPTVPSPKGTIIVPSGQQKDTNIVPMQEGAVVVGSLMDWLKTRIAEIGKTGVGLAAALGVPKARVYEMYSGKRKLQLNEVPAAAKYLEIPEDELIALAIRSGTPPSSFHKRETFSTGTPNMRGKRLPPLIVWKTSAGGSGRGGAFVLSNEKAGEAGRPDVLEFVESAFAAKVVNQDNDPAYRVRDLVWINPEEPPLDGDDCLFTSDPAAVGGSDAIIGKLIRRTSSQWIISQYAVKGEQELNRREYPSAWLIVGRQNRR